MLYFFCTRLTVRHWDNQIGVIRARTLPLVRGVVRTTDERWKHLKQVTQAKKTIGYQKKKQAKKQWITQEMLNKMDEKKKF